MRLCTRQCEGTINLRLLLTSDWQAEWNNLDQCEIALEELLNAGKRFKPDAIICAGDLKEQYNPVDARAIKFWVRAVRQITSEGFRFIVLQGNHDRISQSRESSHWLSILRAAGAETVSRPRWLRVSDGLVALLPFTPDKELEKRWAEDLSAEMKDEDTWRKVLIFHTEVEGAKLNGTKATGITPLHLYAATYAACFGGHLHEHQTVPSHRDNIWYIGSPFCQDWGESGQKKGHLFALITKSKIAVEQTPTRIPGWYDIQHLQNGFVPEKGAYIRSKVPVTSKKITDTLRKEEERLGKKYGDDKRYFVIPLLQQSEETDVILTGSTDREHAEQYVAATLPEGARFPPEQAITYITSQLKKVVSRTSQGGLRVLSIEGENVLCFEKIQFRVSKQGLVLLRGINRDWMGRSNGAGKTSVLSLLPVALFGQTLKGQKTDAWASEYNEETARVRLKLKDAQGRIIVIERTRRPYSLTLTIDGVDQSSGLTGKEKLGGTQALIEEVTGYDLHMLQNSVYIDQTIANGFVFGTQKDRMDLVHKLQNLERYEQVQKFVKEDIDSNEKAQQEESTRLENLEETIARLTDDLHDLQEQKETHWAEQAEEARKELKRLVKEHASITATEQFYVELQEQVDALVIDRTATEKRMDRNIALRQVFSAQEKRHEELLREGKCDRCGQSTKGLKKQFQKEDQSRSEELSTEWQLAKTERIKICEKIDKLCSKRDVYTTRKGDLEVRLEKVRNTLILAEQGAKEEAERNSKIQQSHKKLSQELQSAKRQRSAAISNLKTYGIDRELLEYVKKAFSRGGMPLYLCAGMCRLLNKAAEEYSEIFNGGKLQVRFVVRDGEFQVDIVNPAGSENVIGQSGGETAMAGPITAFAIREAAPKSNILVLDEPGNGLDAEGAKQFANGLLKLKDRFETIIVTTHSSIIESVLAGETTWMVEKKNGISQLTT